MNAVADLDLVGIVGGGKYVWSSRWARNLQGAVMNGR